MSQQKTVLRYLRWQRGSSIHRVAKDTRINASTLSLAERNLVKLTEQQKDRLARYYRIENPDALQQPYEPAVAR